VISRRTLLLAAAASALAACSSRKDITASSVGGVSSVPTTETSGGVLPVSKEKKVPKSVSMVGDSITARSQPALEAVLHDIGFQHIDINAEPSRRIEIGGKKPMPGLDVVKYIAAKSPPEMWIIALGTNDAGLYDNDSGYQKLVDDMLAAIPSKAPLVWINTYRNDHIDGCVQFNDVLDKTLADRGNATVGEWYQQCLKPDQKILSKDGVHPNDDGVLVFADTVRRAVLQQLD